VDTEIGIIEEEMLFGFLHDDPICSLLNVVTLLAKSIIYKQLMVTIASHSINFK
jgi:hypothetical protein